MYAILHIRERKTNARKVQTHAVTPWLLRQHQFLDF
jgi:hypothetical protein